MTVERWKWLFDIYIGVWKQTEEQKNPDKDNWIEYYNNWIDIVPLLFKDTSNTGSNSSDLLICFLLELQRGILWCMTSVFCGAYHSGIRELRFLLEATARCRYIDKQFPGYNQKERLDEFLKLFPSDGKPEKSFQNLIRDTNLCKKINTTWKELNSYVHYTIKELCWKVEGNEVIPDPQYTFIFDDREFREAVRLTNAAIDAIFYLILTKYESLIQKIKKIDEQREEQARITYSFAIMQQKLCQQLFHAE